MASPGTEAAELPVEARRARRLLEAEPDIDGAWLFGSAAKGRLRPQSDIDIAVRFASREARERWQTDPGTLPGRLALAARRDVQLVDIENTSPTLRFHVFRDGRCLFDRRPAQTKEIKVRAILDRFDWEPNRRQIADLLDKRFGVSEEAGGGRG